jgi:GrpB-like predicted nucleotidyltransferase (UPF0157 family)
MTDLEQLGYEHHPADTVTGRVQQYAALKQQLAQRYPHDRIAYTSAKGPFIHTVMANAIHAFP